MILSFFSFWILYNSKLTNTSFMNIRKSNTDKTYGQLWGAEAHEKVLLLVK